MDDQRKQELFRQIESIKADDERRGPAIKRARGLAEQRLSVLYEEDGKWRINYRLERGAVIPIASAHPAELAMTQINGALADFAADFCLSELAAPVVSAESNPVYLELRRIYCCSGAEFCRPTLEKAWRELERLIDASATKDLEIDKLRKALAKIAAILEGDGLLKIQKAYRTAEAALQREGPG